MGKVAAAILLPVFLVGGAVMNAGVMVVDVHDSDGTRIVVPVPVALAQAALIFAPDEARNIEAPEADEYLPYAQRFVEELREAPDGVYVEVDEDDEHVRVSKEGDVLRVRVISGSDESVDVNLPLSSARAMLESYDADTRTFRASGLVSALTAAPSGKLVHVLDGGDEVEIRMLW